MAETIAKPIVTGLIAMAHAADLQPSVNFNGRGRKFAAVCGTFKWTAMGPPGKRTS